MTARRTGPKTAPTRSELHYKTADRRRALKALDMLLKYHLEVWRWRQIAAWTPTHTQMHRTANTMAEKATARMNGYRAVIWRALGYDPEADGPAPTTHWDKGAMED
jgi:hypothetical protein